MSQAATQVAPAATMRSRAHPPSADWECVTACRTVKRLVGARPHGDVFGADERRDVKAAFLYTGEAILACTENVGRRSHRLPRRDRKEIGRKLECRCGDRIKYNRAKKQSRKSPAANRLFAVKPLHIYQMSTLHVCASAVPGCIPVCRWCLTATCKTQPLN